MPEPLPIPSQDPAALPLGAVSEAIAARTDVQAAIAAEAVRSGVPRDAVTVAGYADVTWTDGSIGCPSPGKLYTQALVPGHLLVLGVAGQHHSYHAAEGKDFRYCAHPMPPASTIHSER